MIPRAPASLTAGIANRHPIVVAALLAAVCVAITLPHARAKPFWHDEIYTILM
nr:hypothetical protein [Acidobacteriota bacterium]